MRILTALAACCGLGIPLTVGCASVPESADFPEVQKLVEDRLGRQIHWRQGGPEDAEVDRAIQELLKVPITSDSAIRIALLNNRSLQAEYEELGVAQAELVQAGLLKNPVLLGSARFPNEPPSGTNLVFEITQSFLDLLLIPARKRIAEAQFERAKMEVARDVFKKVSEVNVAFYTVVGAQQIAAMRRLIARATESSMELAKRQHAAGNVSDLNLANEQSLHERSRLELAKAEEDILAARENLTRLLGLWGADTEWKAIDRLPAIPKEEPSLDQLESTAIAQRFDLAALRRERESVARNLEMVRAYRWFGAVDLGASAERETDGQWVIGPSLSIELPIFDQQQAVLAGLVSRVRQADARTAALAVEIRSEVRALRNRLMTTRYRVEHLRTVQVPLQERIVELTLKQYNFMLVGAFELIEAKTKEYDAYQQFIEAVRDYWTTRSELERAIDGGLPKGTP